MKTIFEGYCDIIIGGMVVTNCVCAVWATREKIRVMPEPYGDYYYVDGNKRWFGTMRIGQETDTTVMDAWMSQLQPQDMVINVDGISRYGGKTLIKSVCGLEAKVIGTGPLYEYVKREVEI